MIPDGYMLRFRVNSDFGAFAVTGEYGLRKLIKEIQAISALKKTSKGEAFVEGALVAETELSCTVVDRT